MKTHFQFAVEGLGAYAIPILTMRRQLQTPYLVGTGTLYQSGSESFLITAKHVVDDLDDLQIVTSGKKGFIRFPAEIAAFEYRGIDHDICVIYLPPEVVSQLHSHFKTVGDEDFSDISSYDKLTLYAFVGYPHSKNKPKPTRLVKEVVMKPFFYVVREFREISCLNSSGKTEMTHVAFNAPLERAKDVTLKNQVLPPKPHGISGCGVWMVRLDKTTGVVCQRSLVAVGIEYIQQDDAFIATRISSALAAINQFKCLRLGRENENSP